MVKSVLNKNICEANPSDSVLQALTHKVINYYITYRMYTYPLNKSWLFVYVFVTQLGVTHCYLKETNNRMSIYLQLYFKI